MRDSLSADALMAHVRALADTIGPRPPGHPPEQAVRGYRGICIAGVGPDGWLENWHLRSDVTANLHPDSIERAARFALAMLQRLDQSAPRPVL